LRKNKLRDKGVEYVSKAIMGNKSITKFDIRQNKIFIEGIKFILEALDKKFVNIKYYP
jgi:hypothetical protein